MPFAQDLPDNPLIGAMTAGWSNDFRANNFLTIFWRSHPRSFSRRPRSPHLIQTYWEIWIQIRASSPKTYMKFSYS